MVGKNCFKCGIFKLIECFHVHKYMKDGRLNKCSACVVNDVRKWRKKIGVKDDRVQRYAREIETGKRIRVKQAKVNGIYVRLPPEIRQENRRLSSLKYSHKRNANIKSRKLDELSQFVFEQAINLCRLRNKTTNLKWTLDHIVPINHKLACGLHNAYNFQVVPDYWNYKKRNFNMNLFVAFTESKPCWAI